MSDPDAAGPYPPCPEGRKDCHNDFTVVVSTRYGSLVPQTVHASNLRETFAKVLELPLAAWFPPEDFDLPAALATGRQQP